MINNLTLRRLSLAEMVCSIIIIYGMAKYLWIMPEAFITNSKWILDDWLINYNDGFCRRGFAGTLINWLSLSTGVRSEYIVYLIVSASYVIITSVFLYLMLDIKLPRALLLLAVSPLGFLFPFLTPVGGGRKDVLHLLGISIWAMHISRSRIIKKSDYIIMGIIQAAFTLSHEGIIFYLPFYVAIILLRAIELNQKIERSILWMIFPAIASLALLYLFKSIEFQDAFIRNKKAGILEANDLPIPSDGILSWPADILWNIKYVYSYGGILGGYMVLICYFLTLLYFSLTDSCLMAISNRLILFLWGCIMGVLPLFIIAIDWGRWLHMITLSCVFVIAGSCPKKDAICVKRNSIIDDLFVSLLAVLNCSLWSVSHAYSPAVKDGIYWYKVLEIWKALIGL